MGLNLLADVTEESGNLSDLEKELGEAVSLSAPQAKPTTPAAPVVTDEDANVPEKYRGKSKAQIIEMHLNAESQIGRMANDLGTQRKLTDRLLDLKRDEDLSRNTPPAKVTREELLQSDDPTPVLDRFVESRVNRAESETKARLERMEQSLAQNAFVTKHPDYVQIANDPSFVSWAQQTPYRQRLTAMAVQQNDWAAADELLSEYKAQKPAKSAPVQQDNLAAARAAALESGAAPTKSGGEVAGKVYRRADLIRLRIEDPEKYYSDDFHPVIMKAYAEGRVK